MSIAYIGLGSNLANPIVQIKTALQELAELPDCRLSAASSLYRSDPMGPSDQPDYINAVAALETQLSPAALLVELQRLEQLHQRVRLERWGPRTLDLDLLLYDDQRVDTPDLTVPHPGVAERNFVLVPLLEIAPDLRLPDNRSVAELAAAVSQAGLNRLEEM